VSLSAYCSTCEKDLYIEEEDTFVCPVCSSPLLQVVEGTGADQGETATGSP
jgi:Zn finger protein HypA/HybF involved in hydrogenase expression